MLPSQFLLNATEPKENVQEINDISHENIYKIVFERFHLFLSTAWKRLAHSPKSEPFGKSLSWCCVLKTTLHEKHLQEQSAVLLKQIIIWTCHADTPYVF